MNKEKAGLPLFLNLYIIIEKLRLIESLRDSCLFSCGSVLMKHTFGCSLVDLLVSEAGSLLGIDAALDSGICLLDSSLEIGLYSLVAKILCSIDLYTLFSRLDIGYDSTSFS